MASLQPWMFKYYVAGWATFFLAALINSAGCRTGPIESKLQKYFAVQSEHPYNASASLMATRFMEGMNHTTEPVLELLSVPDLCYQEVGCDRLNKRDEPTLPAGWESVQSYAIIGGVFGVTGYFALNEKKYQNLLIPYAARFNGQDAEMDIAHGNERFLGTFYIIHRVIIEATFAAMSGTMTMIAVHKLGSAAAGIPKFIHGSIALYQGATPDKPQDAVTRKHDELRKRSRFGCKPEEVRQLSLATYAPVGWDMKLTCRKYRNNNRDEDLIQAGRVAMYKLITANADVTTFAIYDPSNLEAHARCSMEYEHFSPNLEERPYVLPGDSDGPWCRGCSKAPQRVDWSIY